MHMNDVDAACTNQAPILTDHNQLRQAVQRQEVMLQLYYQQRVLNPIYQQVVVQCTFLSSARFRQCCRLVLPNSIPFHCSSTASNKVHMCTWCHACPARLVFIRCQVLALNFRDENGSNMCTVLLGGGSTRLQWQPCGLLSWIKARASHTILSLLHASNSPTEQVLPSLLFTPHIRFGRSQTTQSLIKFI